MSLTAAVAATVTALAFMFFAGRRLLRYLHIFQQEEYDGARFLRWMFRVVAIDRRVVLLIGLIALGVWYAPGWPYLEPGWQAAMSAIFILFAFLEPDPRKRAKKKLVMTNRARRIYWASIVLCALAGAAAGIVQTPAVWIGAVWAIPFLMLLGNLILWPFEARTQRKYWNEAHTRLLRLKPTVIGITGSFGKTSVKHILGHILELNARTLYTPGSVNTAMGIARIIREQLKPGTRYFIVEMGAYGIGSIKRLCELTPPNFGILTTIGEAHYERFKSLDAVARAKFELCEAVLKKESKMVVGEAVLAQPYAFDFINRHRANFVICGNGADVDLRVGKIEQTPEGLNATVSWQGETYTLFAPLYGLHHGMNMALAFGAAVTLGIPPKNAIAAMATVKQIRHRLEVLRQSNGSILINDAYNSNPSGFAAALSLTDMLRRAQGRRILVTPGMAELGQRHDAAHAELGLKAAQHIDIALIVRPERIPTFVEAFERRAHNGRLIKVENFAEAQSWLARNVKQDDVVLIENDLPDIYEQDFRL